MGKKIFIFTFFLFSLLFISLVSATTYSQGKDFNYNYFCEVNGTACDVSFGCNLTMSSPDGNVFIDNQPMTNNGTFFSYVVLGQDQMNVYPPLFVTCTDGNISVSSKETIEVTADGKPYRAIPIPYLLMAIGALFFIGNKHLYKLFKSNILNIFGAMLFMIAGVLTLYPGFNYTNWGTLEGFAIGAILIGIGGVVLIESGEEIF